MNTTRILFFVIAEALAVAAHAELRLPSIFSDHAVLQRSGQVPVWGWADPGLPVTVTLDQAKSETTTDANGKWLVNLNLQDPGPGPHSLIVQAGEQRKEIADVLVGEVWLCSGQSNMEFTLDGALGAKEEIAKGNDPSLRQFLVKKTSVFEPAEDCVGEWIVASPETAARFSATAWYFGKNLRHELNGPVGLINASWGGTPCEPWISLEGIAADSALRAAYDEQVAYRKGLPGLMAHYQEDYAAWTRRYGREDSGAKTSTVPSDAVWHALKLPGPVVLDGFHGTGSVWLRKKVKVSPPPTKGLARSFEIRLGEVHGFDTVYWNGQRVGGTTPATLPKRIGPIYLVPERLLDPGGEATLEIRLFNPVGEALLGKSGSFRAGTLPLDGEWEAWVESALPQLTAEARDSYPRPPAAPGSGETLTAASIFNGMIHPLIPYAMRGVIWYQGESNRSRAYQYRTTFAGLIRDWRRQWGRGDFPFYFCQLAAYLPKTDDPGAVSQLAELRESQSLALALPVTGMAVLTDIGEAGDIHPRNKADVGRRLALIAFANTYGHSGEFSGPLMKSASVEGNAIRVRFRHAEGGLVASPLPGSYRPKSLEPATLPLQRHAPAGDLEGFVICGSDQKWHWAEARIEGDSVVVRSPEVAQPVAVRYAWAENPTANLYNAAGLPAAPFRTDDFPLSTAERRY